MKRIAVFSLIASVSAFVGFAAIGQTPSTSTQAHGAADHVMLDAEELKWDEGPEGMPPGLKMAVLEGDPTAQGPFTIRFQIPSGYRVMPHSHPSDEHVTVIRGSVSFGLGEQFNERNLQELGPGGFAMMNAGTNHYAMSKNGAVVQVHGMGPWDIKYVNPADDPREQQAKM